MSTAADAVVPVKVAVLLNVGTVAGLQLLVEP